MLNLILESMITYFHNGLDIKVGTYTSIFSNISNIGKSSPTLNRFYPFSQVSFGYRKDFRYFKNWWELNLIYLSF